MDKSGVMFVIPWDEEYIRLRNRLGSMGPIRHWLSWRLRRRFRRLLLKQQQMILDEMFRQFKKRDSLR